MCIRYQQNTAKQGVVIIQVIGAVLAVTTAFRKPYAVMSKDCAVAGARTSIWRDRWRHKWCAKMNRYVRLRLKQCNSYARVALHVVQISTCSSTCLRQSDLRYLQIRINPLRSPLKNGLRDATHEDKTHIIYIVISYDVRSHYRSVYKMMVRTCLPSKYFITKLISLAG